MNGEVFITGTGTGGFISIYSLIAVTYPSGSICTCGGKTADDTSGYALFNVKPGTYTVECHTSDNSKSKSTSVTVTDSNAGKVINVALSFTLYLRRGIDDCDADTGGWISEARPWGENVAGAGAPIVDKSNTWLILTQNYAKGGIYRTVNKIDLSQYNTLVVELAVSATDSHPEYFTFGVWPELATYYKYNLAKYWNPTDNIGSTVISIDISNLNGSYYVGYGLYNNNLTVASGYVYLK